MKKLWIKISYMGIDEPDNSLLNRSIVLKNQINFVLMLVMIFFVVFTTIQRELDPNGKMTIGSFRLTLIALANFTIMILAYFKKHKSGKHLLVFLPSFLFIIVPFALGFVEIETYFYNPMVIIALSVVTPLIIESKKATLFFDLYYVILLVLNPEFFLLLATTELTSTYHIREFDVIFRLVPVAVFAFIHLALYYLRNMNFNYETQLITKNNNLSNTLSDLKKTQQQLIQSEKMASVGSLTSGVAHEINNPLNIIQGGSHILKSNLTNISYNNAGQEQKVTRSIEMIDEGIAKTSNIVSSLMTFSRRGASKLQKLSVEDIIDKTLIFLKVNFTDNIQVYKDYRLNIPVPVYQDKLHQVILNIVDNAIYALKNDGMNHEKHIVISTLKTDKYAEITISNNGPNVDKELLNGIFDPFYTTKDPGTGTGLGLSICYSLIKDHQGYLFAENKKKGVSFIIKLPLE